MAKSRRESPVLSALPLLSLRGAEGDAAISKGSLRGRQQCLARAEDRLPFVTARRASTKQSHNGQPDMRQA